MSPYFCIFSCPLISLEKRFKEAFGTKLGGADLAFVDSILAEGIKISDSGKYTYVDCTKCDTARTNPSDPDFRYIPTIRIPASYAIAQVTPSLVAHELLGHGALYSALGTRALRDGGPVRDGRNLDIIEPWGMSPYSWRLLARLEPSYARRNATNYECFIINPCDHEGN